MKHRPALRLIGRAVAISAAAFALHFVDGTADAQGAQAAQGGSCTTGQVTGPINNSVASDANNLRCVSSVWQYPVYQLGATTTACNSSTAGSLQWTTTSFKGCDGSSWSVLGSGGGAALSGITAATTTSSIDSGSNAITWAWGTLSAQSALTLSTSSMTSGNLLNLSNTSTQTSSGAVLNISSTEVGSTYGVKAAMTGSGNTGYAGFFSNTSTVGWALSATGTSYFNGNVSIAATNTGARLDIASTTTANSSDLMQKWTWATDVTNWGLRLFQRHTGTSIAYDFMTRNGTSTDINALTISANGSIGIGTNTPQTLLDVSDLIRSSGSGGGYMVTRRDTGAQSWIIYGPSGTTDMRFYDGVDRITFQSGGNVGIGSTSPGANLDLLSTSTGTAYAVRSVLSGTGNTGYAGYLANTGTNAVNYGLYASTSSATGYAGYFQGKVNVTGALTVGSCTGCGGGASLSGITSATTTASINNTNNAITWAWGTLTTQSALTLSTSSMTTGNLLNLSNTSTQTSTGAVLNISSTEKGKNYGIKVSLTDAANTGYAGYFSTTGSVNGAGVYGAGSYMGGYFTSSAALTTSLSAGIGVYGIGVDNGNTAGMTVGVYGMAKSTTGAGVYGYADASSGTTYGVRGESASSSGYGVYAINSNGSSGYGVYGSGPTGGYFTSTTTNGTAVWGTAPAYGVYGSSTNTDGVGVWGQNNSSGYGVYAFNSNDGYAIYAQNVGTGYGGYFTSGFGWALVASGTSYFEGNVGIGKATPGSALDVKGVLRLSGGTSGYVGIAPAAAAGSTTYTLPSADGSSGQTLSTNGGGTLSWAGPPSGTMCGARVARCNTGTATYDPTSYNTSDSVQCKGNTLTVTCSTNAIASVVGCPSGYTGKVLNIAAAVDRFIACFAN